jgi:opacity protein-like surface antigen
MRRALFVCLGLGLCAVPGPAAAENGLYLELQGGATFLQDSDVSISGIGSGNVSFDTGWNAGGAIGFRMFDLVRLEAHGSYRQADLDEVKIAGVKVSPGGFAGAAAFLGNVYLDIPFPLPIKPYIGGGAGVAIFSADVNHGNLDVNGDDTKFAWNVMGGVFWPVWRHLELDVRYRYITSDDPKVDASLFGFGGTAKAQFEAHEVVGALRFVF